MIGDALIVIEGSGLVAQAAALALLAACAAAIAWKVRQERRSRRPGRESARIAGANRNVYAGRETT